MAQETQRTLQNKMKMLSDMLSFKETQCSVSQTKPQIEAGKCKVSPDKMQQNKDSLEEQLALLSDGKITKLDALIKSLTPDQIDHQQRILRVLVGEHLLRDHKPAFVSARATTKKFIAPFQVSQKAQLIYAIPNMQAFNTAQEAPILEVMTMVDSANKSLTQSSNLSSFVYSMKASHSEGLAEPMEQEEFDQLPTEIRECLAISNELIQTQASETPENAAEILE